MSFAAACDWSFLRSATLALVAWPVCLLLERGLRTSPQRTVLSWLLVSPFLFPELLAGYLLAPLVVGRPWRAEAACDLVLLLRSIPIGVVALWTTPNSDLSPAALYLRRLKLHSTHDVQELVRCYWHGPIRRALPALGLMFLMTFQEFEAAALLGAVSWTDQLFTEYALGLSLADSTRFLARPLAIQLAIVLLLAWSLWNRRSSSADAEHDRPISPLVQRSAAILCGIIFLAGVVGPSLLLTTELAEGWSWLQSQPSTASRLATEIVTAGLVALVAGLAAWTLCSLAPFGVARSNGRRDGSVPLLWPAVACSLPGLCGILTVSLAVLGISARWFPALLSTTPLAWVLALVVWLIPRALLLQLWLARQSDPPAMHLVTLLRESPKASQRRAANRWRWLWQIEPQIAAAGLLCYWAYLDLTAAALLAPPGMASVVVRLYNFMHYGHSAAMSMEAAIVMFLPVVLGIGTMAVARTVWGAR